MNSLVTPMFYNQNGEKVNLENWMQNLETQQSTFQTNLTKSVDTKIANLVTLNGVKNPSPNFWAPTTKGGELQVPQFYNGQMRWANFPTIDFYEEDSIARVYPYTQNKIGFNVPTENGAYVIFFYVFDQQTKVNYLGLGFAGDSSLSSNNSEVVVAGQNFQITRDGTIISVEGPATPMGNGIFRYSLVRGSWLRIFSQIS